MRDLLTELGRDSCFVGSDFTEQVGGPDFALDLLFFHRGLKCLVAIELKVDRFKPEHLGKLDLHLEGLDSNAVIALYAGHGTHVQFHSEFKTDLYLKRLPSGKVDTNYLVASPRHWP